MFFDTLSSHGPAVALVLANGDRVTYTELSEIAAKYAGEFSTRGGVVAIEMRNTLDSVGAYLGALLSNTPAILCSKGNAKRGVAIIDTFEPEWAFIPNGHEGEIVKLHDLHPSRKLHPDLGVMLSTSGSTGSPKLVKLSKRNLNENARSIAEYLKIDTGRRAVTNLPLHYSYGLSVLNSHLFAGASIVLTELSVVDDGFWELVRSEEVTDLPGVPYTYELFEKAHFRQNPPPSIKVLTQAGGRLPPDLVKAYSEFSRARGIEFFVMYGQTEATARMAYLPPSETLENADCIGKVIPRGVFKIVDGEGAVIEAPEVSGELVYQGPNVMMGYALTDTDLESPPQLTELKTGDIAEWSKEGYVRIVGRSSRFSKIAGLRIGLDDVERILRDNGIRSYVTGDDSKIVIGVSDGSIVDKVEELVSKTCKIAKSFVIAVGLEDMPTLPSGKIDYRGLLQIGSELEKEREQALDNSSDPVAGLFAKSLRVGNIKDDDSFASLGGDSLSYIAVSTGLEHMLGDLPQHWEKLSVGDLRKLKKKSKNSEVSNSFWTQVSIDIPLRVLAISIIFIGHGAPNYTEWLRGGTGILFCLAGFSLSRFQRDQFLEGDIWPALKGTFLRVILPYWILMTTLIYATHMPPNPAWWFLYSVFSIDSMNREILFSFWFIETLVHCLLVVCLVFQIPFFRRWAKKSPFDSGLAMVAIAVAFYVFGPALWMVDYPLSLTLDGWLYVYLIGWTIPLTQNHWQRFLLVALGAYIAFNQFGVFTGRAYWYIGGLIFLVFVTRIKIPRFMANGMVEIASASYICYLAHPLVIHVARFVLPTRTNIILTVALVYLGSLGAGIVISKSLNFGIMQMRKVGFLK